MPVDIKNILTRLNLDDSYYFLGKPDYVDALNITQDGQEQSQDVVTTNVIGNRLVPYNKPAGTNICIGAKADILRNRVFEFIWNSRGYHSMVILDLTTRTRTKLIENLTDSNGIDVLQFTRNNKIIHADIIYRGEDEGDLLFWTDGNVTPRKLNVKHIQDGDYTYIKIPFIELAKMPPRVPALCVYGTDADRNANSLRKKLMMVTYRWGYDDFEKSTFTTYSKIPLPIGYYGSDNDIDNTKNNFVTITVETGDENVTEIEIAVRFNINAAWDDFILAVSLNKEQLNIPDNSTYDYLFYNDNIYPPIDGSEAIQLFDWVPKKAKSQCSGNGNTIELAAITEGYGNYPISELDVTITATNQTNVPPDSDPPSLTYTSGSSNYTFTVSGTVPEGTRYRIYIYFNGTPPTQTVGVFVVGDYTSVPGDTIDDVAEALSIQFNAFSANPTINVVWFTNTFTCNFGVVGTYPIGIVVEAGTAGGGDISTEKVWMWDANYIFGQAYKDEQGRIMPGVTTFVDPTNSDNDYMVTTPSFSLDSGDVQTPVITAEVNHLPKEDAVTFGWTRRRTTYGDWLMYETCDYQEDTDYLYFCLYSIDKYKLNNSQFIYATAPITTESRIKIIAGIFNDAYNGSIWNQDYEILGTVIKTLSGGSSPDDDVPFIKVKKPVASISPAYSENMLVMIYTPLSNPTDIADSVYFEWAEEYAIYEGTDIAYNTLTGSFVEEETVTGSVSGATGIIVSDDATQMTLDNVTGTFVTGETLTGGTSAATSVVLTVAYQNYHRGMTQDQTATQPAIYVWAEGDVYFHERTMYTTGVIDATGTDTVPVMDSNWSDFFLSGVNDNGRGISIEVNARETYFPATIRYSLEYQQNTNINETNRFKFLNFVDLDRSFGSILKMSIRDRGIRIGQQFKIGYVPMFNQINVDADGNSLRADSDTLLNPVRYVVGDYGVGDAPEAWTDFNFSSYFFDTNRGIWCRYSQDGLTPVSIIYKINSWATTHGVLRGNAHKIYGVFDPKSNNCIFSFEATDNDPSYTLSFKDDSQSDSRGFESFFSYNPEMMVALGSLLITYKNGDSWTHDSHLYNNFYGIQYPSTINLVYNDQPSVKKVFNAISYRANEVFTSPEKGDIITSMINPQTGLQQESKLKEWNYDIQENVRYASFLNDINSRKDARAALHNGDYLNGDWISVKLICEADRASKQIFLSKPYVKWQVSPRNF